MMVICEIVNLIFLKTATFLKTYQRSFGNVDPGTPSNHPRHQQQFGYHISEASVQSASPSFLQGRKRGNTLLQVGSRLPPPRAVQWA